MNINYITGPAACGKTRYLAELEKQAVSKGRPCLRLDIGSTGQVIQARLSAAKEGTVILIDEGLNGDQLRLVYSAYIWPVGAQIFVAGQGKRNTWEGVK
jgi:hypothetical protein